MSVRHAGRNWLLERRKSGFRPLRDVNQLFAFLFLGSLAVLRGICGLQVGSGFERESLGSGTGPAGEEGSWLALPGLPGDENSRAQALGRPLTSHWGIQLEPGGSGWSLPAWRGAGIEAA